jgi:hypothetical protein
MNGQGKRIEIMSTKSLPQKKMLVNYVNFRSQVSQQ